MESNDAWRLTDGVHPHSGKGDPFAAAVRATRMPMIITDPRLPDNPITYANDAFLAMSGYTREEIQGKNCRFLQGPETDMNAVAKIRQAIKDRKDIAIDLLNYRKDGSSFWNALYLSPVINEQGELLFYFASQLDVTERKNAELKVVADKERFEQAVAERTRELRESTESLQTALAAKTVLLHEVDHRVKNNMQIVSALIASQLRTITDPAIRDSLTTTLSRVEAMSTVHRRFYQSEDVTRFDIADFTKDLITDLITATGRQDVVAKFEVEPTNVPAEKAAAVALMVNELATNAIKHAFRDGRPGILQTKVKNLGDSCQITIADDGAGGFKPAATSAEGKDKTFGKDMISRLSRQLQATTEWSDTNPGTSVVITLPIGRPASLQEQRA